MSNLRDLSLTPCWVDLGSGQPKRLDSQPISGGLRGTPVPRKPRCSIHNNRDREATVSWAEPLRSPIIIGFVGQRSVLSKLRAGDERLTQAPLPHGGRGKTFKPLAAPSPPCSALDKQGYCTSRGGRGPSGPLRRWQPCRPRSSTRDLVTPGHRRNSRARDAGCP
jgi:hypothetical protein